MSKQERGRAFKPVDAVVAIYPATEEYNNVQHALHKPASPLPGRVSFTSHEFNNLSIVAFRGAKRRGSHVANGNVCTGDSMLFHDIYIPEQDRSIYCFDISDSLSPDTKSRQQWDSYPALAGYTPDTFYAQLSDLYPDSLEFEGWINYLRSTNDTPLAKPVPFELLYTQGKKFHIEETFKSMSMASQVDFDRLLQYRQVINAIYGHIWIDVNHQAHTYRVSAERSNADTHLGVVNPNGQTRLYTRDCNFAYDQKPEAKKDPYEKLNGTSMTLPDFPLYNTIRWPFSFNNTGKASHLLSVPNETHSFKEGDTLRVFGATDGAYRPDRNNQESPDIDVHHFLGTSQALHNRDSRLILSHMMRTGQLTDDAAAFDAVIIL